MSDAKRNDKFDLANKRETKLAASPLLLFGTGIALTSLLHGGPWYAIPLSRLILSVAMATIPMIVIAIGAFIALTRRLPN